MKQFSFRKKVWIVAELNLKKDYSCGKAIIREDGNHSIKFENKQQQENFMEKFKK